MKSFLIILLGLISSISAFAQKPEIRATITTAPYAAAMVIEPESYRAPLFSGTENYLVLQIKNDSGRMAWGTVRVEVPGIWNPIDLSIQGSNPNSKWETVQIVSLVGFYLKQPSAEYPFSYSWKKLKQK